MTPWDIHKYDDDTVQKAIENARAWPNDVSMLDVEFGSELERRGLIEGLVYKYGRDLRCFRTTDSGEFTPTSWNPVEYLQFVILDEETRAGFNQAHKDMFRDSIDLRQMLRDLLESLTDDEWFQPLFPMARAIVAAVEAGEGHHAAYLGMMFGMELQQLLLWAAEEQAKRDATRQIHFDKQNLKREREKQRIKEEALRIYDEYIAQGYGKMTAYRKTAADLPPNTKGKKMSDKTISRYVKERAERMDSPPIVHKKVVDTRRRVH